MTTLPPLPAENEDPWFEKRQAFDLAVKELLEGDSSPETIQAFFAATLKIAMFEGLGDLIVGANADGGAATILPRGLNGQILQVNNSQPTGLAWSDGLTQAQSDAQEAINIATATAIQAIRSIITEYAVNDSETVAPTTGWSTDQPTRTPGDFIWMRTITTKGPDDDIIEITSEPVLVTGNSGAPGSDGSDGTDGTDGEDGAPGKGLSSAVVTYQVHSNGTTAPTGTWVSTPPATLPGQFLWTRTVLTWTDASSSTAYSVSAHGNNGSDGSDGIDGNDGIDGKGIASAVITYQVGNSGTVAPVGTWTSTPGATTAGQFLWTRTVFTYTDATTSTSYSISAHGATGSNGLAGRGISSTSVSYQVGSSGTTAPTGTWVASPPATSAGQFLWSRTIITYTDSSTSTSYSVSAHGTTGAAGKGISSAAVTYQVGSSGTTAPTGTWTSTPGATSPGQFLWARTITTYTDATTTTSYAVSAHGATGSAGSNGVSVSSVTPYFLQVGSGSSVPAKPTTNPPGGSWSLTEPGYTTSTELYRTELILYSNATFSYTNVSKVSSYTASTQAVTAANLAQAAAQGLIKASSVDPGHAVGRLWMVLDGSGNTIGIKISNGTAWSSYALMADQILVPGSVGPTQIANGAITTVKLSATAIDGMTITGALIRTAASGQRIQLDVDGLKAFNASNVETSRLSAASGALTLSGIFRSGSGNERLELSSTELAFYDSASAKVATITPYSTSPGDATKSGVKIAGPGGQGEIIIGPQTTPVDGESIPVRIKASRLYSDFAYISGLRTGNSAKYVGTGFDSYGRASLSGYVNIEEYSNKQMYFANVPFITFGLSYNRYRIIWQVDSMSVAGSVFLRFTDFASPTVEDALSNYSVNRQYSGNLGVQSNAQNRMEITGGTSTQGVHAGEFTVLNLESSSEYTQVYGNSSTIVGTAPGTNISTHHAGHYGVKKSQGGLKLMPTSGNFSGQIMVVELY